MFEKRTLAKRVDRMFDDPWTLFRWPPLEIAADVRLWAPKVDVLTKDNQLITRVDLPGMTKEDVQVEVVDGYLTLSGERKKETKTDKDNVYREEREYGSFHRTVPLPDGVKAEDVKATFANGVLEVAVPLPKAVVEPGGRKIPIQDAAPAKTAA